MRRLLNGGVIFFLASAGVNALNFLFHVLVSRSLGPDDYSALGALLALLLITAVPLSAVQLASTQAQARSSADCGIGRAWRRSAIAGGAVLLLSIVGAPLINDALHLRGLVLASLVGAWLALAIMGTIPQGSLIGSMRMRQVAIATFVGTGLARVLMGVAFGAWDSGVEGAMLATVLGQGISLILMLVPLRRRLVQRGGEQLTIKVSESLLSVGALTGLAALAAFDTVVARNALPSREAGIYVAGATAGRIALFIPGAIALITFPRFTQAAERGEPAGWLLARSAALVGAISLVGVGVLSAVPTFVIKTIFGAEFVDAADILPLLALTGAALGGLNLFTYFHIASHRGWAALIGWAGTGMLGIGVALRHNIEPHALAVTMLGISSACLLLSIAAAIVAPTARTEGEMSVPAVDIESGSLIPAARPHDRDAS